MAKIHISLKKVTNNATAGIHPGKVRFCPVGRIRSGGTMLVPEPFEVSLDSNGTSDVTVPKTSTTTIWAITELPGTALEYTRYVEIPATDETINYTDLVDVAPGTGVPIAMGTSPLLGFMTANSAQAALNLSRQFPDKIIVYVSSDQPANTTQVTTTVASAPNKAPTLLPADTIVSTPNAEETDDENMATGDDDETADDDADTVTATGEAK